MAGLQYRPSAKNNIPEKLNPLSRVHARHRRQTDGFAMPLAKRNIVTAKNCNNTL